MSDPKIFTLAELLAMPERAPEPLDAAALDRLDALHKVATPDPWKPVMDLEGVEGYGPKDGIQFGGECDFGGFGIDTFNGSSDEAADVRLIAEARNALPALLMMARAYLRMRGKV